MNEKQFMNMCLLIGSVWWLFIKEGVWLCDKDYWGCVSVNYHTKSSLSKEISYHAGLCCHLENLLDIGLYTLMLSLVTWLIITKSVVYFAIINSKCITHLSMIKPLVYLVAWCFHKFFCLFIYLDFMLPNLIWP